MPRRNRIGIVGDTGREGRAVERMGSQAYPQKEGDRFGGGFGVSGGPHGNGITGTGEADRLARRQDPRPPAQDGAPAEAFRESDGAGRHDAEGEDA